MKLTKSSLLSGNDIPFPAARVTIHTPTYKEIALVGETDFLIGCNFLAFDRELLSEEDKVNLANKSDFDIFMSEMLSREKQRHKTDAIMVLALLFPEYKIKIEQDKILLQLDNFSSSINEQNYSDFKDIIIQLFCLKGGDESSTYNPADALAARIAEKLKKRKEKLLKNKGEDKEITVYSNYISILSIGLQIDINVLTGYTLYQLREAFKRFQLHEEFYLYIRAKLAGAQDLEEVDNWMDDIHP